MHTDIQYFNTSSLQEQESEGFFLIKPKDALISQIYFVKKFYTFRAVPLPIIRNFPLYIRHWYMSCRFNDIYHLPNVRWKTPDDGQRNCPKDVEFLDKINLGN